MQWRWVFTAVKYLCLLAVRMVAHPAFPGGDQVLHNISNMFSQVPVSFVCHGKYKVEGFAQVWETSSVVFWSRGFVKWNFPILGYFCICWKTGVSIMFLKFRNISAIVNQFESRSVISQWDGELSLFTRAFCVVLVWSLWLYLWKQQHLSGGRVPVTIHLPASGTNKCFME